MMNFKLTIGQKIAFALGLFLALAVSMAIIGQRIAAKFEASAQAMVTLNYYETFVNIGYANELKYIAVNSSLDTLRVGRQDFDHMNSNAYHSLKEMIWACPPTDRYIVDRVKSIGLHSQFDKIVNYILDKVAEGTAIRRENLNIINDIKNLKDKKQNIQKIIPVFIEAVANEYIFFTSSDSSQFNAFNYNIEKARQLSLIAGLPEIAAKLSNYKSNFND